MCVRVCICGGMPRDRELVLLEIQGIYIYAIKNVNLKKKGKEKSSRISPWNWHPLPPHPPSYPLLKRTFLLPSGSTYQGLRFSGSQQMSCVSLFCCHGERISLLLMSNLGFSLWYLPFGRPCVLPQLWHCFLASSAIRAPQDRLPRLFSFFFSYAWMYYLNKYHC